MAPLSESFQGSRVQDRPRARGRRASAGFTLIELLVVLGILLIMVYLSTSTSSQSFQSRQKQECRKNLQSIYVALATFSAEHGERFPETAGAQSSEIPLALLVPKYTSLTGIFICPGSKDPPIPEAQSFADKKISYAYYAGVRESDGPGQPLMSDEQISGAIKNTGDQVFSRDGKKPGAKHNKFGGNFLSVGGDTRFSEPKLSLIVSNSPRATLLNPRPQP